MTLIMLLVLAIVSGFVGLPFWIACYAYVHNDSDASYIRASGYLLAAGLTLACILVSSIFLLAALLREAAT